MKTSKKINNYVKKQLSVKNNQHYPTLINPFYEDVYEDRVFGQNKTRTSGAKTGRFPASQKH